MKTLNKAIRIVLAITVAFALILTPMMIIGMQVSVTLCNQNFDLQVGLGQSASSASPQIACCGSGNGTSGG